MFFKPGIYLEGFTVTFAGSEHRFQWPSLLATFNPFSFLIKWSNLKGLYIAKRQLTCVRQAYLLPSRRPGCSSPRIGSKSTYIFVVGRPPNGPKSSHLDRTSSGGSWVGEASQMMSALSFNESLDASECNRYK